MKAKEAGDFFHTAKLFEIVVAVMTAITFGVQDVSVTKAIVLLLSFISHDIKFRSLSLIVNDDFTCAKAN